MASVAMLCCRVNVNVDATFRDTVPNRRLTQQLAFAVDSQSCSILKFSALLDLNLLTRFEDCSSVAQLCNDCQQGRITPSLKV